MGTIAGGGGGGFEGMTKVGAWLGVDGSLVLGRGEEELKVAELGGCVVEGKAGEDGETARPPPLLALVLNCPCL